MTWPQLRPCGRFAKVRCRTLQKDAYPYIKRVKLSNFMCHNNFTTDFIKGWGIAPVLLSVAQRKIIELMRVPRAHSPQPRALP